MVASCAFGMFYFFCGWRIFMVSLFVVFEWRLWWSFHFSFLLWYNCSKISWTRSRYQAMKSISDDFSKKTLYYFWNWEGFLNPNLYYIISHMGVVWKVLKRGNRKKLMVSIFGIGKSIRVRLICNMSIIKRYSHDLKKFFLVLILFQFFWFWIFDAFHALKNFAINLILVLKNSKILKKSLEVFWKKKIRFVKFYQF